MNANQPNKETTLLREHNVWELRIRCYSQQQIAQELGISQSAVSQILNRVRDRLAQQYLDGILQMRLEQTEQLLKIAQEAYAAWEQSKQQTEQPTSTPPQEPAPSPKQAEEPTGENPSDPSSQCPAPDAQHPPLGKPIYLRLMLQALAAVRAIWGLEAAEKSRIAPPQQAIKMLIGVDYDHLKRQDGVPVSRKEAERALGQKLV